MISVNVSIIHNNNFYALEFYRANTSHIFSICTIREACIVDDLYLHIVLARPTVGEVDVWPIMFVTMLVGLPNNSKYVTVHEKTMHNALEKVFELRPPLPTTTFELLL